MREQVIERIVQNKVIAIVRGLEPAPLGKLAEAFHRGGISLMELTFNQRDPASWEENCESIRFLSERFQGVMDVGAGTVLTVEQAEMARQAGAKYIISPDANPEVIRYTREKGLVSLPGCLTPTDITAALAAGADFIKVFPAGVMGTSYIEAIRAPLSHARLLAVGGVNEKNAADFIKAGCLGVGVGGNLVNKKWIAAGEFDRIEALAAEYVRVVQSASGK